MKKINVNDLVLMNDYQDHYPIRVELAYAQNDNLLFQEAIYRPDAGLWLHRDLAAIVIKAAEECYRNHGYGFILYDGLRTVDAQEKMLHTRRVQQNPHWLQSPPLLSSPGSGAHPRAMAVDMTLVDQGGHKPDMGTAFDFLADNPGPQHNPAHRAYQGHNQGVIAARKILDDAMLNAARSLGQEIVLLAEEWWDFRLPRSVYEAYKPLHEKDLSSQQFLL